MAAELENRCPICLDSWEEASYLLPCLHQFCYPCILRWVDTKPECPLCKRTICSILHSVRADDDFQEHVVTAPAAPPVVGHQAGGAPAHPAAHSRPAREQQPVGMVPGAPLGGLQPSTWASLFQRHPALLQPIRTWVRQELRRMFGSRRSRADIAENILMPFLFLFGLDEEMMVELMEACLQNRAATFVRRLIDVVVQRCSREARRLLGLDNGHAARQREESPTAAPVPAASQERSPTAGLTHSNSVEATSMDDLPGVSAAALRGDATSPLSAPVPVPGDQEEPQQEPEDAAAIPLTSSGGRERSSGGPRCPPKRRNGSPEASSPAKERPPHGRH